MENYQHYAEKFYDLIKLNNEFREYDFKKNLEIKTHLCEAAEKLADEEDVISAFHQLQKLHQEFRNTGPVAKELREDIWTRFKTASTAVNRRHQQHFEALKEKSNVTWMKRPSSVKLWKRWNTIRSLLSKTGKTKLRKSLLCKLNGKQLVTHLKNEREDIRTFPCRL